ncbi:zinc-finger domain-containing protein [Roseateles sp.]|uniref:zinc-finger domain-containing protein n=1 Tax=Roseateles sp. TaxID=1971397 RepID=UPI0032672541
MNASPNSPPAAVDVDTGDLHGPGVVFCPNPKMPLWSNHPRVFLEVGTTGQGKCPYCGTVYRLAGGARATGGH